MSEYINAVDRTKLWNEKVTKSVGLDIIELNNDRIHDRIAPPNHLEDHWQELAVYGEDSGNNKSREHMIKWAIKVAEIYIPLGTYELLGYTQHFNSPNSLVKLKNHSIWLSELWPLCTNITLGCVESSLNYWFWSDADRGMMLVKVKTLTKIEYKNLISKIHDRNLG